MPERTPTRARGRARACAPRASGGACELAAAAAHRLRLGSLRAGRRAPLRDAHELDEEFEGGGTRLDVDLTRREHHLAEQRWQQTSQLCRGERGGHRLQAREALAFAAGRARGQRLGERRLERVELAAHL